MESLSEISSKYTERSSVAVRTPAEHLPEFLPKKQRKCDRGKKTLVLDLDETLVHSSFTPPRRGDRPPNLIINVKWDDGGRDYVFVKVRPYVYSFLAKMTKIYEVVIFTASILNYAQPLVRKLDKQNYGFQILSRRQCTLLNNWYYKDLSRLARDMKNVIIVDNSPQAYAWQPENGVPILSWFEDPRDNQLNRLVPVLERLAQVDDVREYIPKIIGRNSVNYYEAFKALKAPRETSPLDSILSSLSNFKKEAAAFFSGNKIEEESVEEPDSPEEVKKFRPPSSVSYL